MVTADDSVCYGGEVRWCAIAKDKSIALFTYSVNHARIDLRVCSVPANCRDSEMTHGDLLWVQDHPSMMHSLPQPLTGEACTRLKKISNQR
ncbi:hypothetical protein CIG66_17130 [Ralstonia pseudosolanacearum]|nr:hypothetical protein CIG66_17130 [Ralstonia pseudosolanacearum]